MHISIDELSQKSKKPQLQVTCKHNTTKYTSQIEASKQICAISVSRTSTPNSPTNSGASYASMSQK